MIHLQGQQSALDESLDFAILVVEAGELQVPREESHQERRNVTVEPEQSIVSVVCAINSPPQ
jgi:hypothetical protein